LRNEPARIAAAGAFVALFLFGAPFPLVVIAAALFGFLTRPLAGAAAPPPRAAAKSRGAFRAALVCAALWLAPLALIVFGLGREHVFAQQALFFSKLAVVTFGGAYAALAYVSQAATDFGWVTPAVMMDGLGLAETTPGPLVLVLQFIGVQGAAGAGLAMPPMLAGAIGGAIALWMTFAPCFVWIFLGAPFMERLRGIPALTSALAGVSGAVVGVILNLSLWFASHALFAHVGEWRAGPIAVIAPDPQSLNLAALAIAMASLAALARWKSALIPVIAAAAAAGVLLNA
jgi:chromate transporter